MTEEIKISKRRGSVAVSNAMISDDRLSIEARGLLVLLLSMSENWRFRATNLMKKCKCGKDKYYRMTGELRDLGYLRIDQNRDEGGRIISTHWNMTDDPEALPLVSHNPEKPDSGKSGPIRRTIDKNPNIKTCAKKSDLLSEAKFKLPDWINAEVWNEYLKYKRDKTKSEISERRRDLLILELKKIKDAGVDPNGSLDHAMDKGWTGFRADWIMRDGAKAATHKGRDPDDPMAGLPPEISQAIRYEMDPDRRRKMAEDYWARRGKS